MSDVVFERVTGRYFSCCDESVTKDMCDALSDDVKRIVLAAPKGSQLPSEYVRAVDNMLPNKHHWLFHAPFVIYRGGGMYTCCKCDAATLFGPWSGYPGGTYVAFDSVCHGDDEAFQARRAQKKLQEAKRMAAQALAWTQKMHLAKTLQPRWRDKVKRMREQKRNARFASLLALEESVNARKNRITQRATRFNERQARLKNGAIGLPLTPDEEAQWQKEQDDLKEQLSKLRPFHEGIDMMKAREAMMEARKAKSRSWRHYDEEHVKELQNHYARVAEAAKKHTRSATGSAAPPLGGKLHAPWDALRCL